MPDTLKLRSLTFQLFIILMLVASVPVAITISVGYSQIKKQLHTSSLDELSFSNRQLGEQLDAYHKTLISNLDLATRFAQTMLQASTEASPETTQHGKQLLNFIQIYEYQNLFIGDAKGNIIFNARPHKLKGRNIYSDEQEGSAISVAAETAINNKEMVYSTPSGAEKTSTMQSTITANPVLDQAGELLGFVVIQFSYNHAIPDILESFIGNDASKRSYLLDNHSQIIFHAGPYLENFSYSRSVPFINWNRFKQDNKEPREALKTTFNHTATYLNNGLKMISAYRPVHIADNELLLVTETAEDTIYDFISELWFSIALITLTTLLVITTVSIFLSDRISSPLRTISLWIKRITNGEKANCHIFLRNTEIENLSRSVVKLNNNYTLQRKIQNQRQWLEHSLSGLYEEMNGVMKLEELCSKVTHYLAVNINSPTAAMYLINRNWTLTLTGQYGCPEEGGYLNVIEEDEGSILIEAARNIETIEVTDLPDNFFRIESAHLDQQPDSIYIIPFCYGQLVKGIMVFGSISQMKDRYKKLLSDSTAPVANAVHSLELTLAGVNSREEANN